MNAESISWEVLKDVPRDQELIDAWNGLAGRMKNPSIFSTFEWMSTWWEHFGEKRELRIRAGRRNGELVALAPLAVSRKPFPPCSFAERVGTGAVPTRGM